MSGLQGQRFQFHKGTIKTWQEYYKHSVYSTFQFHKGTIKTYSEADVQGGQTHFNSIKVRLKRSLLPRQITLQAFQFHKGTIKTIVITHDTTSISQFQFHKGTIKTNRQTSMNLHSQTFQFHKGTIKTQTAKQITLFCLFNFNSIKVRLKRTEIRRTMLRTLFQFHKGTIKTVRPYTPA